MKYLFCIFFFLVIFYSSLFGQYSQRNPEARKFESMLRIIDRSYVDTVDSHKLVEDAIIAVLKDLDPHSVYISKEDVKRMNEPLVGNFDGIGIQFNILHDTITVVSPIAGGPSEKLGIKSGDRFITIEGNVVAGVGIKNKDVMSKLRGKKGTKVTVGILRRGVEEILEFTITRDKIPIFSVDAVYMARPGIGYIKVNRFARKTMNELVEGIEKLKKDGMKSLILDLRGNSGGYLNTAIHMADEFLPSRKLIVYTEGRSFAKDEKLATVNGNFEKGKLVVLIDEGSASASEIVSGAIQDWDRGIIIGRRSFGKGLVQKPYTLPDQSMVRLTISRYYTPSGRSIQKPYDKGIEEYHKDILNRFRHGEFTNPDSINLPDSLKFKTANNRTVYGGGGIMPDIFIPMDTTFNSKFYTDLRRKGALREFTLDYVDENRNSLLKKYKKTSKFIEGFVIDEKLLGTFFAFAREKGVKDNEEQKMKSMHLIKTTLKGLIGLGLWNSDALHQIVNELNPAYQKAIEVINNDTFEKMNFNY